MQLRPPKCRSAALALLLLTLAFSNDVSSQAGNGAIPLDGLTALATPEGEDEPSAEPTLNSDVSFFAELLLRIRFGDNVGQVAPNARLMKEARRVAILTTTIGKLARQIGEKLTPAQLERTRMTLRQLAGGEAEIQALIDKYGISNRRYQGWVAHLTLAQNLVGYEISLITPQLSDPETTVGPAETSELSDARRELTATLRQEQLRQLIDTWLGDLIKNTSIRLVQ